MTALARQLEALIKVYVEQAGLDAAKDLCIGTLAKLRAAEPYPESITLEEASPFGIALAIAENEARIDQAEADAVFTRPQPAEAAAEITRLTEGWDDPPDVAQPSAWHPGPGCTIGATPGVVMDPTTHIAHLRPVTP